MNARNEEHKTQLLHYKDQQTGGARGNYHCFTHCTEHTKHCVDKNALFNIKVRIVGLPHFALPSEAH
jgi:hypothetical protein